MRNDKGVLAGFISAVVVSFIFASSAFAAATPAASAAPTETHAQAAQTFADQAIELRSKSASHRAQAKRHRGTLGKSDISHRSMANHCERIADSLAAAAEDSDELAAMHRRLINPKN